MSTIPDEQSELTSTASPEDDTTIKQDTTSMPIRDTTIQEETTEQPSTPTKKPESTTTTKKTTTTTTRTTTSSTKSTTRRTTTFINSSKTSATTTKKSPTGQMPIVTQIFYPFGTPTTTIRTTSFPTRLTTSSTTTGLPEGPDATAASEVQLLHPLIIGLIAGGVFLLLTAGLVVAIICRINFRKKLQYRGYKNRIIPTHRYTEFNLPAKTPRYPAFASSQPNDNRTLVPRVPEELERGQFKMVAPPNQTRHSQFPPNSHTAGKFWTTLNRDNRGKSYSYYETSDGLAIPRLQTDHQRQASFIPKAKLMS